MAYQANAKGIETVGQMLGENELPYMADAMRALNEAIWIERSQALEAAPYEHTERRKGGVGERRCDQT